MFSKFNCGGIMWLVSNTLFNFLTTWLYNSRKNGLSPPSTFWIFSLRTSSVIFFTDGKMPLWSKSKTAPAPTIIVTASFIFLCKLKQTLSLLLSFFYVSYFFNGSASSRLQNSHSISRFKLLLLNLCSILSFHLYN